MWSQSGAEGFSFCQLPRGPVPRCCSYAANDQAQALGGPIPMLGPDAELAPAHGEAGPAALRGCEARICVHILPKNAAATLHVPDETLPDYFLRILQEKAYLNFPA